MTIFDAGAKVGQAAIGYSDGPGMAVREHLRRHRDVMRALVENIDKSGFTRDEPWQLSGSSLPEHGRISSTCNGSATTARIGLFGRLPAQGDLQAAGRRHRVDRPEPVPWVQEVRGAVPVQKPMYRGTTRVSEKCIACYPRIEGKDP